MHTTQKIKQQKKDNQK